MPCIQDPQWILGLVIIFNFKLEFYSNYVLSLEFIYSIFFSKRVVLMLWTKNMKITTLMMVEEEPIDYEKKLSEKISC